MNYFLHLLIMISIYFILSLSLNILIGYSGLVSFCHSAFYGIGAYATALLMMKLHFPFTISIIIGIALSVFISLFPSLLSLRLKQDYFYLTTIGFQIIIFSILYNWLGLTNGPYGISDIPNPSILGIKINTVLKFALLSTAIFTICFLLFWGILSSPFGRTLKAIREDELLASTLGKRVYYLKITAFALSAGFASVSGALFACYMHYIDPTSFTLSESFFILSAVLIGGAGNIRGPLIGTIFVIIMPEILRSLHIPDSISANLRQIIYGFLILILMRFRPQGLGGEYKLQ